MNTLIIGSGGREHAMAWKIKQSSHCKKLYIAPGNPGTGMIGENVAIEPTSFPEIADFVIRNAIELVIVGPEVPLALGIRNYFSQKGDLDHVLFVGPDKKGALLESSKDFAKQFMVKYGIPTASYATFSQDQYAQGVEYLHQMPTPIVLKADGLAAGKGVVICESLGEAERVLKEMLLDSKFGQASAKVVVEEFLKGIEISVFVITDGNSYKILPSAKDYKRIGENDTGPNTGGMGAVSPVPFADEAFMSKVEDGIIRPTIEGLKAEEINYRGFIFLGLINVNGEPKVIEYNVRMGDPETQAVFPLVSSDPLDLLVGCARGTLDQVALTVDPRHACTVVMVAGGYPESYQKGEVISGLQHVTDSLVFHAGTRIENGEILTNGGRVLAVTSLGSNLNEAINSTYRALDFINWKDSYLRTDIGADLQAFVNKTLETSPE